MNAVRKDPAITHENLIGLFRELEQTIDGSRTHRKALGKLKKAFATAINEAEAIHQWRLDMLQELDKLTDPKTGKRICPQGSAQARLDVALGAAIALEHRLRAIPHALQPAEARA
jgi:hypothetical protein